jgi:hypothetical protein
MVTPDHDVFQVVARQLVEKGTIASVASRGS